jgi:glutaredoxin
MGGSKQDKAASFYVSVTLDLSVAPYQIADSNKSLTTNTTVLTYHTHMHVPYIFLGRRNHFTKDRILFNSYGFF